LGCGWNKSFVFWGSFDNNLAPEGTRLIICGGDRKRGENFLKNLVIFLDNRGFGLYNCKIRE
jgi:hypothetical protein